jgi:hypothetical protein
LVLTSRSQEDGRDGDLTGGSSPVCGMLVQREMRVVRERRVVRDACCDRWWR